MGLIPSASLAVSVLVLAPLHSSFSPLGLGDTDPHSWRGFGPLLLLSEGGGSAMLSPDFARSVSDV
jgi:hypothetical protein